MRILRHFNLKHFVVFASLVLLAASFSHMAFDVVGHEASPPGVAVMLERISHDATNPTALERVERVETKIDYLNGDEPRPEFGRMDDFYVYCSSHRSICFHS